MPNYWGKQIFTHGSFSEVGKKQKTEKKKKEKDRKLVMTMAKLRMAHASRLGQLIKPVFEKLPTNNQFIYLRDTLISFTH